MLTHHQSQIALGSMTDIVLVSDAPVNQIRVWSKQLWLALFEFERMCSRFLQASELSMLNRSAGTRQWVSPAFQRVLLAAAGMAHETGNLYNPFILPALQRAGYTHSMVAAHHGDVVDDFTRRTVVSPENLEVGDGWACIPYGTALDLGGCGKGYAGDMLADLADTFLGVTGYWFSLGGDIVSAGHNEEGLPWTVMIENAATPDRQPAGHVKLRTAQRYAVATSSTRYRRGTAHGKKWHHIIDPRTGSPVRTTHLAITVCAETGLKADVMASCLFMLDDKDMIDFARAKNLAGILVQSQKGADAAWGIAQLEEVAVMQAEG